MKNIEEILTKLMKESNSLIDLREKLIKEGLISEFSNYKKYLTWLKHRREEISTKKIRKIYNSLKENLDKAQFPTISVKIGGVTYKIHGILHGGLWYFTPGFQVRKNVKKYISRMISSFHNPPEEDYLYEQGLHNIFDLPKSQELKDTDILSVLKSRKTQNPLLRKIKTYALYTTLGLVGLSIAVPLSLFLNIVIYFNSKRIQRGIESDPDLIFLHLKKKATVNEKYQNIITDIYIAKELPQPFDLELQYLRHKRVSLIILKRLKQDNRINVPTTPERSLRMAKQLLEYTSKNKELKVLHFLVGMAHATQIAYFLKHPDYSFKHLDEYLMKEN